MRPPMRPWPPRRPRSLNFDKLLDAYSKVVDFDVQEHKISACIPINDLFGSVVRETASDAEGREFESHRAHHFAFFVQVLFYFIFIYFLKLRWVNC
jgi:hypothetical protein